MALQTPVLKVAFASDNRRQVNQHFGSALGFVTYDISPQGGVVTGFADFPEEAMDGNENKLAAKVDFLEGCAAVFVMAIGASAIKQLMSKGIQPIRIGEVDGIDDLIADVCRAMKDGGVAWIDRAVAQQTRAKSPDRFSRMEDEGWDS